jgi:hypothetical protein
MTALSGAVSFTRVAHVAGYRAIRAARVSPLPRMGVATVRAVEVLTIVEDGDFKNSHGPWNSTTIGVRKKAHNASQVMSAASEPYRTGLPSGF